MRAPLFSALLGRELGSRAATQRMIVVVAVGVLCGYLAGGLLPVRPRGRPGSLELLLAIYEQVIGFFIGMLAALRLIATLHADQRDGWLTQPCAFGTRRDAYLAQLTLAVLLAAAVDYLVALATFLAAHAVAGGAVPFARVLGVVPAALAWMSAALALGAAAALVLNERTRARFAVSVLLPAPYVVIFLAGQLTDDRGPPVIVMHLTRALAPFWSAPLTLASAGYFAVYASVALAGALLLAPARVERSP